MVPSASLPLTSLPQCRFFPFPQCHFFSCDADSWLLSLPVTAHFPAMASTIPLLDGLTSVSLREAKGSEISFWIEKTNAVAGKRVLTKNGHVDDKQKRLAEYYDINLSAGTAVVAASVQPKMDKEHIKERQFSWLRELGEEWSRTTSAGREFALCDGSSGMPVAVVSSLHTDGACTCPLAMLQSPAV